MNYLTDFLKKFNLNALSKYDAKDLIAKVDYFRSIYAVVVMFIVSTDYFFSFAAPTRRFIEDIYLLSADLIMPLLMINFVVVLLKVNIKQKIIFGLSYLILNYSYSLTGANTIIVLFLTTMLFLDVDFKKAIRSFTWSKIFWLIMAIPIVKTGSVAINDFTGGSRVRHALCFGHPNQAGMIILITFLGFWWLYLREHKLVSIGIASALFVFVKSYIDSQTSAVLFLIFIIAIALSPILKHFEKARFILATAPLRCMAVSYGLTAIYPQMREKFGPSTFMARFDDAYNIAIRTGFPLFGGSGEKIIGTRILDNAYMRLMLHNGLAVAFIFMALMTYAIIRMVAKRQYGLVLITILLSIHGIMEMAIFFAGFNLAALCAFCKIDTVKSQKKQAPSQHREDASAPKFNKKSKNIFKAT